MKPLVEKLKRAISESENPFLSKKLFDENEIVGAAELFKLVGMEKYIYADVPVNSIFSLSNNRLGDIWFKNDTWGDVGDKRLRGNDWNEDVFEYFENDIYDRVFPAKGARNQFKLTSYGGVTIVNNGNGRTATGCCWLAATKGVDAKFKKVSSGLIPVDRKKARMLREHANKSKSQILFCLRPTPCVTQNFSDRPLIQLCSEHGVKYYTLDSDLKLIWSKDRDFWQWLKCLISADFSARRKRIEECFDLQSWTELDEVILEVFAECSWFDALYSQ